MTAFANSLTTNLAVTGLVLALVFLLPWMDRLICRRLGLNLQGGVSSHPRAEALLRLRQGILLFVFGVYLAAVAFLVFFSRNATQEYQVHVALFEDLTNAVTIDFGFLDFIKAVFTEGISSAMSHIQVVKAEDIYQAYLNVMLFVPMGYLLPYLFRWFRAKVRYRPALACFVISFLIENLQLIFRRGFYDVDDLASNTVGGIIGQLLFLSVAYVVTHPNWRKEMRAYRRWKRNARHRTLYPFARRMGMMRTTLLAQSEEDVWDFYIMKLGFRMVKQIVPLDAPGTDMLLQMGKMQVEIHCANEKEALSPQTLTLSVRRLAPVIRRMEANGIPVSEIFQDAYTGLRCVRLQGPDNVKILVIEN